MDLGGVAGNQRHVRQYPHTRSASGGKPRSHRVARRRRASPAGSVPQSCRLSELAARAPRRGLPRHSRQLFERRQSPPSLRNQDAQPIGKIPNCPSVALIFGPVPGRPDLGLKVRQEVRRDLASFDSLATQGRHVVRNSIGSAGSAVMDHSGWRRRSRRIATPVGTLAPSAPGKRSRGGPRLPRHSPRRLGPSREVAPWVFRG